jgi:hypothetical protein
MAIKLNISLDLGGDSLKVAYAYDTAGGKTVYGKLSSADSLVRIAFPALAYYDEETGKWLYGEQVDQQYDSSFTTVVKIKELMSFLSTEQTQQFYVGNNFPKFYFPKKVSILDDFERSIKEEKTFFVKGSSPQSVCESYFEHVKKMIGGQIKALEKARGVTFENKYTVSLVHPPVMSKAQIAELSRIVKKIFGSEPYKVLSSTKALGMYAKYRNVIAKGDNLVIFDMGEEAISVAKVMLSPENSLIVDGVEGHMEPLAIGGVTIDDAIASFVQQDMTERHPIGVDAGSLHEDMLVSKQYQFMKSVKNAKTVLSRFSGPDCVFANGAPIGIHYEVYIKKLFTHLDLCKCIGTKSNDGVAKQISDYIMSELEMPLNSGLTSDATKVKSDASAQHGYVVLSGGLSETYSLKEYIEARIDAEFKGLKVITFDDNKVEGDNFTILSHEDSAYAPAVGGAMVALHNDDVKTVLSLSYGTWVNCDGVRCLDIFVDRGRVLSKNNAFTLEYGFGGTVKGERLYSTTVTHRDIKAGTYNGQKLDIRTDKNGKKYLRIGEEQGDPFRDSIKDLFHLQTVTGGDDAVIRAMYKDHEVASMYDERGSTRVKITVTQGIAVDEDGKIAPTYGVHSSSKLQRIRVNCVESKFNPSGSILAGDLTIEGPSEKFGVKQS